VRVLVVVAFGGVVYGLVTIIGEGTGGGDEPPAVRDELEDLQSAAEALAVRLEDLRRGDRPPRRQARRALTAQRAAVRALGDDPDRALEDALNAEFDWLDGVNTVLRNPSTRLLGSLGERGEAAIDAFEDLDDDHGLARTIRGVASLTRWAEAQ